MYAENGAAMRQELAALLRQHRVQQRLGGTLSERGELGVQMRQYRQNVLVWCRQALYSTAPLTFSNQAPAQPNPFRAAGSRGDGTTPATELARAVDLAVTESSERPASLELLTTPVDRPVVELWRGAARAAALAEHDTAPDVASTMTMAQAQAVVGDVAAIVQTLVILDQRYRNTPEWEPLAHSARLGWAALATALDVSLGQPDYSVDRLGWRPSTKLIGGPPKSGILGVLQAEHNLVVRMKAFPNATNLRYVIDSQRLLSRHLAPYATRSDARLADRWNTRADTYTDLQRLFRPIGGRVGKGGYAAAEGANAVARIRALPNDTIIEPRALGGFQLLFDRLDRRIVDVIEQGIDRQVLFQRVSLPRLVERSGGLVAPVRERFVPVDRTANRELVDTVRERLQPRPEITHTGPGAARADLHAALIHRPPSRNPLDVPGL